MLTLGLSAADQLDLMGILKSSHVIETKLQVLDLDHNYIGDISDRLLAGQVDVDITTEITRSLDMDILDPFFELGFDPSSPVDGSMFANRMICAMYCVLPPDRSRRYDIPIFTGPINKLDRTGPILKVEGQGKESLASHGFWTSKSYGARSPVVSVIRQILEDSGETKFNLADSDARTTEVVSLSRDLIPWQVVTAMATGLGMVLFYDGTGTLQLRRKSASSVWQFDSELLTLPEPGYDLSNVFNAVEVIGAKPKGHKQAVSYRSVAAPSHPLSPQNLMRGGKPQYLVNTVTDTSIKTTARAKQVADSTLAADMLQGIELDFTALPVPMLEEYDAYNLVTDHWSSTASIQKVSIPLTSDGSMSVGSLREVTPSPLRINVGRM